MSGSSEELPRQLPFGFAPEAAFARDDLVVTRTNAAAAHLVDMWPDWPSPVVILTGPAGSGKSHLADAWRVHSQALSAQADRIGTLALEKGQGVLIEDADRRKLDETGLFHLINEVRAMNGWLLITARSAPGMWDIHLADLASRLRAATLVEIGAPDDSLLAAVIFKLFADRQIEIGLPLVDYLVARMDRSLAAAQRLVELLDSLSLERKSRVTRSLAAEALGMLRRDQAAGES